MKKRILAMLMALALLAGSRAPMQAETARPFADVPGSHWSYDVVHRLRDLGITEGIGGGLYGLGRTITRAEFATFLVRLRGWETVLPQEPGFIDVAPGTWYYGPVETAAAKGVFGEEAAAGSFRPLDDITREEMALMIVHTLEFEGVAEAMAGEASVFSDVAANPGYIELLRGFGIVNGIGGGLFAPQATAKREEAAAILVRMHDKLTLATGELTAFYAVSGYSQKDLMGSFDRTGFGWAGLGFGDGDGIRLAFNPPEGFEEPLALAADAGSRPYLSIYADDAQAAGGSGMGILTWLLKTEGAGEALAGEILATLAAYPSFDGVVIDFEGMAAAELKPLFSSFIEMLDARLEAAGKGLVVMVPPDRYYKAYDYRRLGEAADKVVLMAHDYSPRSLDPEQMAEGFTYTPLAPAYDVYDALRSFLDEETGIREKTKASLQVSFDIFQWGVGDGGAVVNTRPYRPTYGQLYNRLVQEGTTIGFDKGSMSPFAVYRNEADRVDYTLWYEDARSVAAKMRLAKLMGISGFSFWRLGNFPAYTGEAAQQVHLNVLETVLQNEGL